MDPEKKEASRGESREGRSPASGLASIALVSQLGMTITLPIVLGAVAGHWLDGKLGTSVVFFLLLLLLGLASGFIGAWRLIITVGKRQK